MKGEQNVNGVVVTNVLEMMKQYRLDLEQQNIEQEMASELSLTIDVKSESFTNDGRKEIEKHERSERESITFCKDAKNNEIRTSRSASQLSSPSKLEHSPLKKVSSKSAVPSYMQPTKSSVSSKTSNVRQNRKK